MALIQISNLQAAGSELFADNDSFLTDLQETDSRQVFGGGGGGYGCGGGSGKGSKKSGKGSKKSGKGSKGGKGYGGCGCH